MATSTGGRSADVLADIYDSAVEPAAWARLPQVLARLAEAQTCAVYYDTGRAVGELATFNLAEASGDYVAHYHQLDPWLAAGRARPRLASGFGDELVPQSVFAESEYYRDFARHCGIFHLLGAHHPLSHGLQFNIGLHRPRDAAPFDETYKALLDPLLPHIQRALQLRRRLALAEARAAVGFAGLSALSFAAIVCDAEGRVQFANPAAERLDESGAGLSLGRRNGGIAMLTPSQTQKVRLLIRDATTGGTGGAIRVEAGDCAVLLVLVTPLPRLLQDREGDGLALVAVSPAADRPGFGRTVLSSLFRFTAAEAELALALLTPRSLEEIAADRKVSMATLRTQMRSLFAKTGTECQRDLVRLLGTIPQIR